MKTTVKRILVTLLAVLLVFATALPAVAEAEGGTVTVTLEDAEENRINGIVVHLCYVAELKIDGYHPTAAFESSGISLSGVIDTPDEAAARSVADYVKKNRVTSLTTVTENGKATFLGLPLGIWLVYGDATGDYTFNPFLVFLPYESDGTLHYEVASAPKVENGTPSEMNVYVFKKWDDNDNAAKKRPETITVELLNGDVVAASVELSEANGWSHTFYGIPKDGRYSIREKSVADYKVGYGGDAQNGFVITNTYVGEKLPQTGQYWWPIAIIGIAGVCFVLLGIYEIGVKKHGEKT